MHADDLAEWVDELRGRLERGDLADLGPIDPGDGSGPLPGELRVRIMLADLDHHADLPLERRREPLIRARRRRLLEDLRRLRERIG